MIEALATLEATALAQALKVSRWGYPLINAGHILGLALLVGAVVPMNLAGLGLTRRLAPDAATAFLRPFAVAGLVMAAGCGSLLFITQAGDYLQSGLFRAKMGLLAAALAVACVHAWRGDALAPLTRRTLTGMSLALWLSVLLLGRLVGYSF